MLFEGRKQARVPERLLVQISAVRDPLVQEVALVENLSPRGCESRPSGLGNAALT